MRPWVAGAGSHGLLLGVTPEIADLSRHTVAVDWNAEMIGLAWPGDDAQRTAVLGDWLTMPLDDRSIDCAFGDACLSTLDWPGEVRALIGELERVLRRPGRIVLRCFTRPRHGETPDAVVEHAHRGRIDSFGAFKLRFAMAVAEATGSVSNSGACIHAMFDAQVADRDALAAATGWPRGAIDTIDAYAGSAAAHSYPTRAEVAAILPADCVHRFVETSGYPLAERCPLLIADLGRP